MHVKRSAHKLTCGLRRSRRTARSLGYLKQKIKARACRGAPRGKDVRALGNVGVHFKTSPDVVYPLIKAERHRLGKETSHMEEVIAWGVSGRVVSKWEVKEGSKNALEKGK